MSSTFKNILFLALLILTLKSFGQKIISDKSYMCKMLTKMIKEDQNIRDKIPDEFQVDKGTLSKKQIDSLKLIRFKIDTYNTEKLISLTKKYGWISSERINCPKLLTWLIFRHSDPKYFDEISVLIKKENNAKRLSDWHYELINNHIQGRPH